MPKRCCAAEPQALHLLDAPYRYVWCWPSSAKRPLAVTSLSTLAKCQRAALAVLARRQRLPVRPSCGNDRRGLGGAVVGFGQG
jgi:hypothetical protein